MSYEVSISKCDTYEPQKVRTAVEASLAALGGLKSIIEDPNRVLIKLNLFCETAGG
jgi:uncharacterized protein (DUF362 family)